jgi:hypothetical protein
VVASGEGLIAWTNASTNGRRMQDENGTVAWWRSSDGHRWQPITDSGQFDRAYVLGVAAGSAGLMAVGGTYFSLRGLRQPGGLLHRAWWTPDGTSWQARDPVVTESAGNRTLSDIATREDRQVAVGSVVTDHEPDATFLVRDGAEGRWQKQADVPGATGTGWQSAKGVCATAAGFVVVGKGSQGPVWFSPNGLRWQQSNSPALSAPEVDLQKCAATSRGFLATGTWKNGHRTEAAVFSSPDGLDWTRVASDSFVGSGDLRPYGLATEDHDALLYGSAAEGGDTSVAMWRSTDDGQSWKRLKLPGDAFQGLFESHVSVAAIRRGVAYVGGVVDDEPAIWSSPLAETG